MASGPGGRKARGILLGAPCYFCCKSSDTEEHFPSRQACRRDWPRGHSFPCCERCNAVTSGLEQGLHGFFELADWTPSAFDPESLSKALSACLNNASGLLPQAFDQHPEDADVGWFLIDDLQREALDVWGRKLACSLYHRQFSVPVPIDFSIAVKVLPLNHDATEWLNDVPKHWRIEHPPGMTTDRPGPLRYAWGGDANHFMASATFKSATFFQLVVGRSPGGEGFITRHHADDLQHAEDVAKRIHVPGRKMPEVKVSPRHPRAHFVLPWTSKAALRRN